MYGVAVGCTCVGLACLCAAHEPGMSHSSAHHSLVEYTARTPFTDTKRPDPSGAAVMTCVSMKLRLMCRSASVTLCGTRRVACPAHVRATLPPIHH